MNNKDLKFASTLYVVPHTISPGEADIPLSWDIEVGDGSMIEHASPGCGCTADVSWTGKRVNAIYNDNTKREEVASMPGKTKTVSKNIRLFLKDGKPLRVKNERGVEAFNAQKASITLFFHVNVVV